MLHFIIPIRFIHMIYGVNPNPLKIQANMISPILNLLFLFSFTLHSLYASQDQEFPVLYKGRYRPAEAYARLWLYHFYHASTLKQEDLLAFHTTSSSSLRLLWSLDILGHFPYQTSPLFWIESAEIKQLARLPLKHNRFNYLELKKNIHTNQETSEVMQSQKLAGEWSTLLSLIKEFENLHAGHSSLEEDFRKRWMHLKELSLSPKEIEHLLEQEYPLSQRLRHAGRLFQSLPSRYKEGEWLPLKALKVQVYHSSSQTLKEVDNFTLFSNEHFEAIRQAYFTLEKAYIAYNSQKIEEAEQLLGNALQTAYQPLAGKIYQEAYHKQLAYPDFLQLNIETLYVSYPWIPLLILLYGIGACLLLIFYRLKSMTGLYFSTGIIALAILFHTTLLAMRCYILGRPPVANMFETVIYVPWVATCISLLFPKFRRQPLVLLAACLTSITLLLILEITNLNPSLDQVQAVLDSQFWLMIHVLLVVGSYGIFILGAIIGHLYLGIFITYGKKTPTLRMLSEMILQTMYGGTALLISGTILGGIWAAESWGRFWDWDPKESWAFISSCFYLICIHAYRFHYMASFGLAIGAVGGLLAISFTWYGVNHILGTGLHSYGFGSGGEVYYYVFLGIECLLLTIAFWSSFCQNPNTRETSARV